MHVVAYAAGYATGTMTGITIERFIAYGIAQVRIITRGHGDAMAGAACFEGEHAPELTAAENSDGRRGRENHAFGSASMSF